MLHRGSVEILRGNLRPTLAIGADTKHFVDLPRRAKIEPVLVAKNVAVQHLFDLFPVRVVVVAVVVLLFAIVALFAAGLLRVRPPHCTREGRIYPTLPGAHGASNDRALDLGHGEQTLRRPASGDAPVEIANEPALLDGSQGLSIPPRLRLPE